MRVESPQATVPENQMDQEVDLGGLGRAIAANRKWVIGATLFALLASTAFVNIVKPRYTAETRMLLELQDSFTPRTDKTPESAGGAAALLDAEAVGSQIQLVTSRDVARRAIKAIGLLGDPEFDPLAGGMGVMSRIMVLAGLKRDPTQLSPEDRVLETYFEKLTVFSPTKTRVLNIEFQAHNPDLAAKAANTIADIYLDFQQEAKREVARTAAGSLAGLVADLKERAAAADSRAEEFRIKSGLLLGSNNATINTQQLGEVNTELSRARTSQADAQAKAKLIREMIRQGRVTEIPDVANNDLIRKISEQRINLRAQLALESRTLLPGHPRIKELNAQLMDLDSELRAAGDKTARTLENDARIAGARVENLQGALDQQKKVVGASSVDEVKMRELDRSARQIKDELEAATNKYQEALARESSKSTPADARIVGRAVAPQMPSFPKKLPIIGFSTIAALVLSLATVVARQLLSDRPVRRQAPAPAPLEVVSARAAEADDEREDEGKNEGKGDIAASAALAPPKLRAFARTETVEAGVRGAAEDLSRDILDQAAGARTLALVVCDGSDDRGFALATARAVAREARTVLVALDSVARMPGAAAAGLGDLFAGAASFHETIRRDPTSRLHLLAAGAQHGVDAQGLWSALDALTEAYDVVIVAASRMIDVEEAQTLAQVAHLAAVFGDDAGSADRLAAALVRSGLPQPLMIGADAAAMDQSAA